MEDRELLALARSLQDLIRPRLRESESAREAARLLGKWLLEACDDAEPRVDSGAPPMAALDHGATPAQPEEPPHPRHEPSTSSRGIVPLKIGDATMHISVLGTTEDLGRARRASGLGAAGDDRIEGAPGAPIDLSLIARRCRLKAKGCMLYIERRAAAYDEERERPILDTMRAMIDEGKSMPNCFLWMFWPKEEQPSDASLRIIARCYDTLAESASLTLKIDTLGDADGRAALQRAMQQMAEADSALRVALEDSWLTKPDSDQQEAHLWLRHESAVRDIYLSRFMRIDDPADPMRMDALLNEIGALRGEIDARSKSAAQVASVFNQIKYHTRRLERQSGEPDEHDQRKVSEAIETLLDAGMPATDKRFAEAIPREVAERMPADGSRAAAVLHWIITRADAATRESDESTPAAREWSAQVRQARDLLEGKQVVIIGGEPRNEAIARIREAFGLSDVVWVRLTEHGTGEPMRAPIMRPETALVFVLIRFVGHLHAEEAAEYARAAGKRCVYVRAGYNPERLADAVLNQASERMQIAANEYE